MLLDEEIGHPRPGGEIETAVQDGVRQKECRGMTLAPTSLWVGRASHLELRDHERYGVAMQREKVVQLSCILQLGVGQTEKGLVAIQLANQEGMRPRVESSGDPTIAYEDPQRAGVIYFSELGPQVHRLSSIAAFAAPVDDPAPQSGPGADATASRVTLE